MRFIDAAECKNGNVRVVVELAPDERAALIPDPGGEWWFTIHGLERPVSVYEKHTFPDGEYQMAPRYDLWELVALCSHNGMTPAPKPPSLEEAP